MTPARPSTVELVVGRRLAISVHDPLGGAEAPAVDVEWAGELRARAPTTSWVGGTTEIEAPTGGRGRVLAMSADRLRAAWALVEGADARVDLALRPREATARGHVRRAGAPVADLPVLLRPAPLEEGLGGRGLEDASTRTDADGAFAASCFPGALEVVVGDPAHPVARASLDLPPGATREVDLVLPGGHVAGVVTGVDGAPVAGIYAILSAPGAAIRAARTGDDGRFAFDAAPSGPVWVAARQQGAGPRGPLGLLALDLADGVAPVEVVVVVRPGACVAGRVLDPEGAPVAGVGVEGAFAPVDAHRRATTDQDGRFTLEQLYDGAWSVSVVPDDLGLLSARRGRAVVLEPTPLVVRDGADAALELRVRDGP